MSKFFKGELEKVNECPYCGSSKRNIAHKNVSDWSFNVAHGKWCYYTCDNCKSLHLNPRPTFLSIREAYINYYTHGDNSEFFNLSRLRILLKNAWLSFLLEKNISPKLYVPKNLMALLVKISGRISLPFWIKPLVTTKPGKFLDIGCGSGAAMTIASQIGWDVIGIDFDEAAVAVARKRGLTAFVGTDKLLDDYHDYFDFVLSSHVLEHVHEPLKFLIRMCNSVSKNGMLVITLPNAMSFVRDHFGDNWRGLEAPRHLNLPSQHFHSDPVAVIIRGNLCEQPCATQVSSSVLCRALGFSLDFVAASINLDVGCSGRAKQRSHLHGCRRREDLLRAISLMSPP